MIEKIEEIVSTQVEAIRNLKIDKVTVWDSGAANGTSSTANFASNLIKSLPPLHEVARMAGVDLPEYLGQLRTEPGKPGNGASGDASPPAAAPATPPR
jgi:flotillin